MASRAVEDFVQLPLFIMRNASPPARMPGNGIEPDVYRRDRNYAAVEVVRCVHCGQLKSALDFSPDWRKRNRLDSWCLSCRAERRRELRAG